MSELQPKSERKAHEAKERKLEAIPEVSLKQMEREITYEAKKLQEQVAEDASAVSTPALRSKFAVLGKEVTEVKGEFEAVVAESRITSEIQEVEESLVGSLTDPERDADVKESLRLAEEELHRLEAISASNVSKNNIGRRIFEKTKKIIRRAMQISLIGALGLVANQVRTSERVNEGSNAQGEKEFTHSDPETEHILNYLTGKESLTPEERRKLAREMLKLDLMLPSPVYGFPPEEIPEDFDSMDTDTLIAYLEKTQRVKRAEHFKSPKEKHQLAESMAADTDAIPLSYEYDPRVYEALWKMEHDVGAPKIRWKNAPAKAMLPTEYRFGRGMYSVSENTMYISPVVPHGTMFAEASHARQFRRTPVQSYLESAKDGVRLALKVIEQGAFDVESINRAYGEEYATPGSVEEEAHSHIQPELEKKFGMGLVAKPKRAAGKGPS